MPSVRFFSEVSNLTHYKEMSVSELKNSTKLFRSCARQSEGMMGLVGPGGIQFLIILIRFKPLPVGRSSTYWVLVIHTDGVQTFAYLLGSTGWNCEAFVSCSSLYRYGYLCLPSRVTLPAQWAPLLINYWWYCCPCLYLYQLEIISDELFVKES